LLEIREMQSSDIDFALSLTEEEGWSSIRSDFEELRLFDQHGCFIAEEEGISIGMACALSYGPFGTLGNLILVREYRGRGYGTKLMEHGLEYLKNKGVRFTMLDAVPKAVPLYERLGFRKVCRSLRLRGRVEPVVSARVRTLEDKDMLRVLSIDREQFGANRFLFLGSTLSANPNLGRLLEVDGQIAGFLLGSRRRGFVRLAPWIMCSHFELAKSILKDFAVHVGGAEIRTGVLETSRKAIAALKESGLYQESFSWRMVHGKDRIEFSDGLFAIGSPMRG
jgi:GNAT superfamily N-acetyltransferase